MDSALTTQLINSTYIRARQSTIDSIGQLSNVDLSTAPSTGQILKWDGSKFSPADDATGIDIVTDLELTFDESVQLGSAGSIVIKLSLIHI